MTLPRRERYFVACLGEDSYRPSPDADFEVQILNDDNEGEISAYFARDSNVPIALIHATQGRLPIETHHIPDVVIDAARKRRVGFGEYVDEKGNVVPPSFLPPWAYDGNEGGGIVG
jgi:hypothetical protein